MKIRTLYLAALLPLLVSACTGSAEEKACRDWAEWQIDTPSTIANFQAQSKPGLAEVTRITPSECDELAWPGSVCSVLTAPTPNGMTVAADFDWDDLPDLRDADLLKRREVFATLSEEQVEATLVNITFDADNSYGAAIRHQLACTVMPSAKTGKPFVLDADMIRGF